MSDKAPDQTWELTLDGRAHLVEARGSMRHQVRWYVDGDLVAEEKTTEEKLRLAVEDRPELGALLVRFSKLGHGLRATVFLPEDDAALDPKAQALTGLGGVDLVPEPGSKAAAHEDRIRAHPRRYALIQTALGVAKVVVPIIVALLLARLALRIPLPDWDLPNIPWPNLPDLPSIPWPDIPRPDLPEVGLPGWLLWLLDKAKYVVPVLVAVGLAQGEIKRRQKQDQLREELRGKQADARERRSSAEEVDDDQHSPGPP